MIKPVICIFLVSIFLLLTSCVTLDSGDTKQKTVPTVSIVEQPIAAEKISFENRTKPDNSSGLVRHVRFVKSTGKGTCPISDLSAVLYVTRDAAELYYMDFSKFASSDLKNFTLELKLTEDFPVQVIDKKEDLKNGITVIYGLFDPQKLNKSLRRKSLNCKRTVRIESNMASSDASEKYAKLLKQAKIKAYHKLLRKYAFRMDLNSEQGQHDAFELLSSVKIVSYLFHKDRYGKTWAEVTIKVPQAELLPDVKKRLNIWNDEDFVLKETNME